MNQKNYATNLIRVENILLNYNITEDLKKKILLIANNDKDLNIFFKNYSKFHGKTKQVKKEFLMLVANEIGIEKIKDEKDVFFNQKKDAELISNVKDKFDYLEKINSSLPEDSLASIITGVPLFDGSIFIRNIIFNAAEYSNIKDIKDVLDTLKNNGHIELNSIIKASYSNEKLFYAYIKELHSSENSFVHNYIPKEKMITVVDLKNHKEDLLKELKIYKLLFSRLSVDNKELAFFCETNDLINILNKSVYYLKLDKNKLLEEKDNQFTPDVFGFFHHRVGAEIIKNCLISEFNKTNKLTNNKTFFDKISANYEEHNKAINEIYFLQTKKNINKDLKKSMKLNIDFNTIKGSFLHAQTHLNTLKEYVSSDINFKDENLKIIDKIEKNIELLINNLHLYNKTNKEYRDNLTLVNMSLGGNISFSLPLNLQKLELVDINGKKILYETKNNKNEIKTFYQLCNETSNLYQNLLINKNTCLSDERQISVAMLSKDNFEFFKAGEKFESFAIKTTNTLINKRKEEMGKLSSVANGIEMVLSKLKNKNEDPTEMNLLGIGMNSISAALMIKAISGDFIFSAMKILDKSSNILDLIKEISLNKDISSDINDTIREIKINNNEIEVVNEIFSDMLKMKHQNSNGNILESKIREKVATCLKKHYSDESLDKEVIKHISRKKI